MIMKSNLFVKFRKEQKLTQGNLSTLTNINTIFLVISVSYCPLFFFIVFIDTSQEKDRLYTT